MTERSRLVLTDLLLLLPAVALVVWQAPALCAAFGCDVACGPDAPGSCVWSVALLAALAALAAQLVVSVAPVWIPAVLAVFLISAAYVCGSLL